MGTVARLRSCAGASRPARFGRALASLALALPLAGCLLPHWREPQAQTLDSGALPRHDVVAYRTLSREDFLARELPLRVSWREREFQAWSCLQLRPADEAAVQTERITSGDGGSLYLAAPRRLRYEAAFDRDCSWWNQELSATEAGYVLRHEQIHFLIMELAARRLNRRLGEITAEATVSAASADEAFAGSRERLRRVMQQALEQTQALHRSFDRDASHGYHDKRQALWWNRLLVELAWSDIAGKRLDPASPPGAWPMRLALALEQRPVAAEPLLSVQVDQSGQWWNRLHASLGLE